MKVVDARTGRELKVGDVVAYGGGEWLRLIDVEVGLFSASAVIETGVNQRGITRQIPLTVRWLHPKYLFQRVGIIPS